MPLTSAVLIIGKRDFGDALCQFFGFVDSLVTYVTPATMGLMAFNRYMQIVKTNHYNWRTFEFTPGYAVCSITFTTSENRIIHYGIVLGLFFVLPFFVGFFSYYKVFMKIRQHELDVGSSVREF